MKNRTMNRIATILITMLLIPLALTSVVSAAPSSSMNITIRIEGISANFYDQTIAIPYSGTLTVKDALSYLDSVSGDVTITGLATSYITDINGESAGTFGGFDGWNYAVNSVNASVGIDSYSLNEGDSILLYYGDSFTIGVQLPKIDASRISEGILKFTSDDTTYDASFIPTVTTNPVVGATVTWYHDGTSTIYTTDASGEVSIPAGQLTAGSHRVQIEKYAAVPVSGRYLPLAVRLSQNASVTVSSVSSSSSSSSAASSPNAHTGDTSVALPTVFLILSFTVMMILLIDKKKKAVK